MTDEERLADVRRRIMGYYEKLRKDPRDVDTIGYGICQEDGRVLIEALDAALARAQVEHDNWREACQHRDRVLARAERAEADRDALREALAGMDAQFPLEKYGVSACELTRQVLEETV